MQVFGGYWQITDIYTTMPLVNMEGFIPAMFSGAGEDNLIAFAVILSTLAKRHGGLLMSKQQNAIGVKKFKQGTYCEIGLLFPNNKKRELFLEKLRTISR